MKQLTSVCWIAVLYLGVSLLASAVTADDQPFRPETGKFPPLEKALSYRGELVFVDHANRRGSIRVQGAGMFFRNAPHPFAMLPYGVVRYHGAPAELRDIQLGTVLHIRAFLQPDPKIASATRHMGRGFILPAPMLPVARYRSFALPTPMSTGQFKLPVRMVLHDSEGREIAQHKFGMLDRSDSVAVEVAEVLDGIVPDGGYGHMELLYDFDTEGAEAEADGWLHGLFRYEDRVTGHAADTSFGAHVFNGIMTFK